MSNINSGIVDNNYSLDSEDDFHSSLSKCQSPLPKTVLLRTTLTLTIRLHNDNSLFVDEVNCFHEPPYIVHHNFLTMVRLDQCNMQQQHSLVKQVCLVFSNLVMAKRLSIILIKSTNLMLHFIKFFGRAQLHFNIADLIKLGKIYKVFAIFNKVLTNDIQKVVTPQDFITGV